MRLNTQHTNTMTIHEAIQDYKAAKTESDRLRDLPNKQYDPAAHYKAIDRTSALAYRMLNHPDWSVELQAAHYPQGAGAIAYPVSC